MSRVLLIADICRDVFLSVDCHRLSPENPVPVVVPYSVNENLGMGGNVLANLQSLDPTLEVVTRFPDQPSVKTRYVDRKTNHHFIRVDQDAKADALTGVDFLRAVMMKPDAIVISDYAKGYLNPGNIAMIARFGAENSVPVFADTKGILGDWSKEITFVKINAVEFDAQLKAGVKPWEECQNLIVTRGGQGVDLYDRDGSIVFHTDAQGGNVVDSVGAGDTVLAAMVVKYLVNGNNIRTAMEFAMKAASIAVSKRGVVAVKWEEVA